MILLCHAEIVDSHIFHQKHQLQKENLHNPCELLSCSWENISVPWNLAQVIFMVFHGILESEYCSALAWQYVSLGKFVTFCYPILNYNIPVNQVHWANMGPTCVLWAPGGSHVGPMNLAIWDLLMRSRPGRLIDEMMYWQPDSTCGAEPRIHIFWHDYILVR